MLIDNRIIPTGDSKQQLLDQYEYLKHVHRSVVAYIFSFTKHTSVNKVVESTTGGYPRWAPTSYKWSFKKQTVTGLLN